MTNWYWLWPLLLLPLAAYTGWWTARRSQKRDYKKANIRSLPQEYIKGLNYVLNEQPDKAIEVFIKMLEVDSETIETHLALGNLFRRRGEVDRAIRIHQNLIARPNLSREQRSMVLMELGMDYMRSGLLDRAEGLFLELVERGHYAVLAYRQLLIIYQQEKDWTQAITVARRLESISDESLHPVIAQFYCELAVADLAEGRDREARDNLRRALNLDPRCVRASILEGKIAAGQGKYRAAIKYYKRVVKQDPDYIPEIIQPLLECYQEMGKQSEFIAYMKGLLESYKGITPALYITDIISHTEGDDEAIRFISSETEDHPTVRGVDRLLEYAVSKTQGETQESLTAIKNLTRRLLESRSVYKCQQCGFDAKHLHWQCPGCKNWNTVKPVYGVGGE
jgi:lipopolysaccharide biosynthesis regulator YciM